MSAPVPEERVIAVRSVVGFGFLRFVLRFGLRFGLFLRRFLGGFLRRFLGGFDGGFGGVLDGLGDTRNGLRDLAGDIFDRGFELRDSPFVIDGRFVVFGFVGRGFRVDFHVYRKLFGFWIRNDDCHDNLLLRSERFVV